MDKQIPILIKNATIFAEDHVLENSSILLKDGTIVAMDRTLSAPNDAKVIDGSGLNVLPGFIDGHIHGAAGADVMDATEEALDTMASALPKEGTTSFLATTITQSPENIERALKNAADYTNKPGQAEVIGVHLEGPFIEESKKGAQPAEYILEPDIDQFEKWQELANNRIKTITMAPEHDQNGTFINALAQSGVNVSAGHTIAGLADLTKAVSQGLRQLTHLCNAMPGIHHREIGAVGAAFRLEQLRAELIADGIHVVPEMLQLIYDNIGSEPLILITDAMRAKGLEPGDYELGGQPVKVTEDKATLENGSLAGSILKMHDGARNMLKLNGVTLKDIVQMASVNPAKQIGVYNQKGSLAIGKDADVVLVDDNLNISYTICGGIIAYKEE